MFSWYSFLSLMNNIGAPTEAIAPLLMERFGSSIIIYYHIYEYNFMKCIALLQHHITLMTTPKYCCEFPQVRTAIWFSLQPSWVNSCDRKIRAFQSVKSVQPTPDELISLTILIILDSSVWSKKAGGLKDQVYHNEKLYYLGYLGWCQKASTF